MRTSLPTCSPRIVSPREKTILISRSRRSNRSGSTPKRSRPRLSQCFEFRQFGLDLGFLLWGELCLRRTGVAFGEAPSREREFDPGNAAAAGATQECARLAQFRHGLGDVLAGAVRGEDRGGLLREQIATHQNGSHVVLQRGRNVVI